MAEVGSVTRPRRVTVVAAGSLATCPRAVKAADAFAWAGWDVRVVNAPNAAWAGPYDVALQARHGWRWSPVDVRRAAAPARWLASALRQRVAERWLSLPAALRPHRAVVHAFSRVHSALVEAILREPSDVIYGGTTGALSAIAEASGRSGTPCGIDFEDLHCATGEADADGARHDALARLVMADVAPRAAFLTGGSAAIAAAITTEFHVPVTPIHNVFPLAWGRPPEPTSGPLKLYWFSQTISPGRGLEDVVSATGRLDHGRGCELHVRGTGVPGYLEQLTAHVARVAPALRFCVHEPSDPDAMADDGRACDAGLATEASTPRNRGLALSNKALTYPLSGLALVLTETAGQAPLADSIGDACVRYSEGSVEALAGGLSVWLQDRAALTRAREASWEAARRRWHWEHPLEREALVAAMERVM